jgi:hypothetical protein
LKILKLLSNLKKKQKCFQFSMHFQETKLFGGYLV